MAFAANPGWTNDPHHPDRNAAAALKNPPEGEADILDEPYAMAILEMGDYQRRHILQAAKALKKQNKPLTAEALLRELMEMDTQPEDKQKSVLPTRKGREHLKRPADDRYGSDGESDDGILECPDASSSMAGEGDLQEDGEAVAVPIVAKVERPKPLEHRKIMEPPEKKTSVEGPAAGGGKDLSHLRRKLQALREENQRLKRRQMCRKCQVKAASITFLPCGHFAFCYACGQGFQTCPLCRKTILADVRTFLA